jgi:sulfate permease, SulP family
LEVGKVPGTAGQCGDVERHPENQQTPGIAILRIEGALFFASAEDVRSRVLAVAAEPGTRAIVIDAESVPSIDVTAARMISQLGEDLDRQGVRLVFARDIGQVRDLIRSAQGQEALRNVYPSIPAALEALPGQPGNEG